ncbi:MAG: SMC-Scp complex subunit ScpB [Candidatus Methylomirabilales bacterium]
MTQHYLPILEALLFASPEPLSIEDLQEILGETEKENIINNLNNLKELYKNKGSGLTIVQVAGGFRMSTHPDLHPWLSRLARIRPARLSRPALETLAIIAYRQPITKTEIEAIRGVLVDGVLKTLIERELIRILGRKREAGRPILYGTSRAFLEYFGFQDISDLPSLQEIQALAAATEDVAKTAEGKRENP